MQANYAESLEDSQICQLQASHVQQLMETDPSFTLKVSKILASRVQDLEERLSDGLLRPVPARVTRVLTKLSYTSRLTNRKQVRLTHEQLAQLLGITREMTSRTLADFAAQGIIRQGRGRILITNDQALYTQASIYR